MNSLGERIKDLRRDAKLTQRELAQILSITVPTLSHWECNYQEPSYKDILRICNYFSISADYLLGRTDELGAVITPFHSTDDYTDEEKKLIADYRELTPPLKRMIQETLKTWKSSEINTKKLS